MAILEQQLVALDVQFSGELLAVFAVELAQPHKDHATFARPWGMPAARRITHVAAGGIAAMFILENTIDDQELLAPRM
jgi:hypothetical protein